MKRTLFAVTFASVLLTAAVALGQTASTGKAAASCSSEPKTQPLAQLRPWWDTATVDKPNLSSTTDVSGRPLRLRGRWPARSIAVRGRARAGRRRSASPIRRLR